MWKKIVSGCIAACFALLVLYSFNRPGAPDSVNPPPGQELETKQAMLEENVALTEQLCRSQCSLHFKQTLFQLKPGTHDAVKSANAQAVLDELRGHHPQMAYLEWVEAGDQTIVSSGSLPAGSEEAVQPLLQQAKHALRAGQGYQSPRTDHADQPYIVISELAEDGKTGLVGVISQEILFKVAQDQQKNLRLVPYPSDNRWKIESVDSRTLRDVKVDHPEDNEGTSHYHTNQVVVKFESEPTADELEQIRAEAEAVVVQEDGLAHIFESRSMETEALMRYFQKWNISYAEPHFLYVTNEETSAAYEASVPNDRLYAKYQWNLPAIETIPGWDVTRGSSDVVVAVIDTGVDTAHPDLAGNMVDGVNMINRQNAPADDVGHGTHVAGIIAALVNNGEGVAGISWYNKVMPIKVLDQTGAGTTYSVAQGIIWAADHGAKVINLSLGNYADAQFLHDAIRYAYDKDVVLIAASGNDNTQRPGYPAAYPEVLAVAATDSQQRKASFSNYGDYIDVAAPGVSIASTYPGNQYAALSGTSMATPHATALAALIRSANPQLKNTEVMDLMRQTAVDLGTPGKDPYYGHGQIDIVKALSQAAGSRESLVLWPNWFERELDRLARQYLE